jgi:hypothetical protein
MKKLCDHEDYLLSLTYRIAKYMSNKIYGGDD